MLKNAPLKIDLNNLFQPAIKKGLSHFKNFKDDFDKIHKGLSVLRLTKQIGFSELPYDTDLVQDILQTKSDLNLTSFDHVILFGIGGSALGPHSIYTALNGEFESQNTNHPKLLVLDNIEPLLYDDLCQKVSGKKNFFLFVSKSGNTSETLAQFLFAQKTFNLNETNTIFITDSKKGFLRDFISDKNFKSYSIPENVGGRFSVLSPVGLVPLAFCGVDIQNLLEGAKSMEEQCRKNDLSENPAGLLATTTYEWMKKQSKSNFVMLPYSSRLKYFADWFCQLFGESLGKRFDLSGNEVQTGFTPIKSLGATDQHSQLQLYLDGPKDKLVNFIEIESYKNAMSLGDRKTKDDRIDFLSGKSFKDLLQAEKKATEESLRSQDVPNFTVSLPELNAHTLGQLYQLYMNVIPLLGGLDNINPFDQPAVEQIKKFTFALMGKAGFEKQKEEFDNLKKSPEFIF